MNTGSTQPPDNLLEGHFSLSSICVPKEVGIIVSIPHLTMGVKGSDRQWKWRTTCILLGPNFLLERPVL